MTAKRGATARPRVEPDADTPLSDEEFARGLAAVLARRARAATGLSQSAFAARYGVSAASLKDWEQGRRVPDVATRSYLRVIARIPEAVAKALSDAA
ncbi:MAG: helix-turn-helix domain-containing protein [Pseudomonadota bacterium]